MSVKLPNIKRDPLDENEFHGDSQLAVSQVSSPYQKTEDVAMLRKPTVGVLNAVVNCHSLQAQFDRNNDLIDKLKNSILTKKQSLRAIGDEVDKDLNKNLFKSAKGNVVNLRDIFSAPPRSDNQHVNRMNDELKSVRYHIKKVKLELGANNPVADLNQERGKDYHTKLKQYEAAIRQLQRERSILKDEIGRGQKQCGLDEQKFKEQQCKRMVQQFNEVYMLEKEKKLQLYKLEKQDIYLMEKIKFLSEKHKQQPKKKKSSIDQKHKIEIQKQIAIIIKQINDIISQRNKIESQKKLLLKSLQTNTLQLKNKNQSLFSKLRSTESYLLQYYQTKSRRNTSSKKEQVQQAKKRQARVNRTIDTVVQKPLKKQSIYDDKNIESIKLSQKKKTLDFGSIERHSPSDIILSDDIYGVRNKLVKFVLFVSQSDLVGFQATYRTPQGILLPGYRVKMIEEAAQELELNEQIIEFVHVGVDKEDHIRYVEIRGREKHIKWGSTHGLTKEYQKNIQDYSSIHFKAKLIQSNNKYILGAMAMSIFYLANN